MFKENAGYRDHLARCSILTDATGRPWVSPPIAMAHQNVQADAFKEMRESDKATPELAGIPGVVELASLTALGQWLLPLAPLLLFAEASMMFTIDPRMALPKEEARFK